MTDPEPVLLGIREVAKRLRVSTRTVQNLIHSGQIAAIQVSGRWKIPETEILPRGKKGN